MQQSETKSSRFKRKIVNAGLYANYVASQYEKQEGILDQEKIQRVHGSLVPPPTQHLVCDPPRDSS